MSIFGALEQTGISSNGNSIQLTGRSGRMDGFLLGAGTAANPALCEDADKKFLSFYLKHDAPSGDNRGLYLRTYFAGGVGGDSARLYATVLEDSGTVHGAHISLSFTAGAQVSGQGIAARCTLELPNDVLSTGHLAAVQAEVYLNGTSAGPGSSTCGLFRAIVDGGDATAKARVKNFLIGTLPAGAYDSGNMFITTNDAAIAYGLRSVINGTTVFFALFTTPVAP